MEANSTGTIITIQDDLPQINGIVAGVDEAGRGPLVGAVVAAAVVLDPARPIEGLADSKKLTPARREQLAEIIIDNALAWSVASCSARDIDTINILQATLKAMQQAVLQLSVIPDHVLVDGNRCPVLQQSASAVINGDNRVMQISAASILAKVTRDRQMVELHQHYPQYGFDQHKGYPTRAHLEALAQYGPCPEHRVSYAPVRKCFARQVPV